METGKRFGHVLSESAEFHSVDLIVPVPLHPKKLKKRGYNQSEWIARGIAESMQREMVTGNLYQECPHINTNKKEPV